MASRRAGFVLLAIVLVTALFVARSYGQHEAIRALTADIRKTYGLPPNGVPFPIASLGEVIPRGSSPRDVVRRLRPLRERVASERWVTGKDVIREPFSAHVIGFSLVSGGVYRIAFVYRNGALWDIDTPEYLGRTADLPSDSGRAWVRVGAT